MMEVKSLAMPELLRHFRNDIAAIWVISMKSGRAEILRDAMTPQLESRTLDYAELEETYRREYVYPPDLDKWTGTMSFSALKALCGAGCLDKSFNMRFRSNPLGFEWRETLLSVLTNGRGEPDRILLSSRNINAGREAEIIKRAVETEYDFVIYLEAAKNSYLMYNSNRELETPLPPAVSADYEFEVSEFHRKYVPEEERDRLIEKLRIAHVRPILKKHGRYVTYCQVVENGVLRDKKLRFSYFDRENDIWLLTRSDITEIREEKRRKKLIQDALNAATEASRAKSEFLSRMSHDIRTPMNAIIGMTAIAGMHIGDRERVSDCLGKITMASKLLLNLINEVLDMSKVESGKIVLSEEEIELPNLVQGVVAMVQPTIDAKKQRFSIHLSDVKNESVIGDFQRLQQVLLNLLSNAVKYTPQEGHILFEVREKPSAPPGVGCYEFIVADDGIGMKPEFLERVFEPFERADDASIGAIQGTGLGMSISRNIVELMNGGIAAQSVYGEGSKFTVTVYLQLQRQISMQAEMLARLPVLVVDDDETICRNTCKKLAELGMVGHWTLRGRDAVDKIAAAHEAGNDYFALIVDLRMPDMDGIETARQIRKEVGSQMPIVMISAYDWSEYEEEALNAGVNDFIMKPIFQSRLVCKLKRLFLKEANRTPKKPLPVVSGRYCGKRVLLAEDNELNREIAQEFLSSAGCMVETAENGKIAVERVSAAPEQYYDLIFMDIQMPVMGGCEAAAAIRALPRTDAKTIPIVAMTAAAFSDDIQRTKQAGMNEHMSKPIDLVRLDQTLKRWLSQTT